MKKALVLLVLLAVALAAKRYVGTDVGTDVANWFDGTNTNNGWILRGNEAAANTAKRFWTREGTTPPVLTVLFRRPLP